MLQIISVLLENKPGALLRVTGLLSARGYNIESLTVARTVDPELSRMTIVFDVEERLRTQVVKQMNKLINVLQATDLTDTPSVCREMVLVRVRTTQENRTAVIMKPRSSAREWSIRQPRALRWKPRAKPKSWKSSSM